MRPSLAALALLATAGALALATPDFVRRSVPDFRAQGYTGHAACRSCHLR